MLPFSWCPNSQLNYKTEVLERLPDHDPPSGLFPIRLPLSLYPKTISALVSNELPDCYIRGPCTPALWQNMLLSLNSLWVHSLLWLLEFCWFLICFTSLSLFHSQHAGIFLISLIFSLSLLLLFSLPDGLTNLVALTSTSEQVTLEFPSLVQAFGPGSDLDVQLITRHHHLDNSQRPQIQCTHTSTHCLPPKTCLSPITASALSSPDYAWNSSF